jgi:rare lipoprotein A
MQQCKYRLARTFEFALSFPKESGMLLTFLQRTGVLVLACGTAMVGSALAVEKEKSAKPAPAAKPSLEKPALDRSGKARKGRASYYGKQFHGKKMADGAPMDPHSNVAASKTLPLGTKAEVTNLENGKSEVVEIRDRGPYVEGRIVDVSPKVAEKLDMKKAGVAPVVVKPIEVPQADGSVKPGIGAGESKKEANR